MTFEQFLNSITIEQAYETMDAIDRIERVSRMISDAGFMKSAYTIGGVYDQMAKLIEMHEGV